MARSTSRDLLTPYSHCPQEESEILPSTPREEIGSPAHRSVRRGARGMGPAGRDEREQATKKAATGAARSRRRVPSKARRPRPALARVHHVVASNIHTRKWSGIATTPRRSRPYPRVLALEPKDSRKTRGEAQDRTSGPGRARKPRGRSADPGTRRAGCRSSRGSRADRYTTRQVRRVPPQDREEDERIRGFEHVANRRGHGGRVLPAVAARFTHGAGGPAALASVPAAAGSGARRAAGPVARNALDAGAGSSSLHAGTEMARSRRWTARAQRTGTSIANELS